MSVVLYARMHNIILRLVCVYIQEVYYSIYYAYYERSMSIYYYIIYVYYTSLLYYAYYERS